MLRFFCASLLLTGLLASCTPRVTTVAGVTVTPVLIKVSEGAAPGDPLTIQGRYLGNAQTARVLIGADENGQGGTAFPASAVQSWSDTQIVLKVPEGMPAGGSWQVRFNSNWDGYDQDFASFPTYGTDAEEGSYDDLPFHGHLDLGPYAVIVLSRG